MLVLEGVEGPAEWSLEQLGSEHCMVPFAQPTPGIELTEFAAARS